MGFRERALAEQGVDHGNLELFRQQLERAACVRNDGAMAHEQQGLLGLGQKIRATRDLGRVAVGRDGVTGQIDLNVVVGFEHGSGNILGNVDENGAGTSRFGYIECLFNDARDVVDVPDQVGMLDGGIGDAHYVRFLERVQAEHGFDGLAGDNDHGHGVHGGGHDAGDGVGRAGTRGDQNHAGLAGGAGEPVGHVGGALFVAGEDELDGRIHQGIENGDCGSAWMPEDVFYPMLMDAMD
jgi:hypothetical protein